MSTADVNLVRFGFAGIALWLGVGTRQLAARQKATCYGRSCAELCGTEAEGSVGGGVGGGECEEMTRRDWAAVAVGVIFVTVLTPLVMTWVMFELPLAVAITLSSITPIWALPVAFCHGEVVTTKAVFGAALASAGVVMLAVK
mmetsp:Transcript_89301/g.254950  ORF Transcript_89301/g.254950 Transcript_89301/m.254950 type:complete len:143 (-) Transcript_89301:856-1284(-)